MAQVTYHDNTVVNASTEDDEINFSDLVKTIIRYWKIAVIITAAILLGSLVYVLLVTPVYKAKVSYLPPTFGDVAPLRIPTSSDQNITEKDLDLAKKIYMDFEKNLNSLKLRREIFDKMNLLPLLNKNANEQTNIEAVFNKFNEKITIEKPIAKKDGPVVPAIHLTLKGSDPQFLADVLNQISDHVQATTKQEVIRDISEQVSFKKAQLTREINELRSKAERQKNDMITKLQETDQVEREKLEDQIKTLRDSAKTKRMDQITVLTEAAKIAESIGLVEKSALLENTAITTERNAFYTEVNTQPQPLYLRGSKALQSEIKELTERRSDDPFIPGLRDLEDKVALLKTNPQVEALKLRKDNDAFIETLRDKESELAILEAFKIDPNQVKVASLDQAAYPPETRESPKRTKIIAFGAIIGLFLGIMAAFMVNFWHSLRLEDAGKAE
ncbi:LPS O-antigen chain length determinant protein, WzzB/FepE family [Thiothrix eikelboomii]|uniref:LPS O-antigen chain length determinant protein, WzzB/FepE family n=1 Tax=Thiothrix eikelboomii TaxID=92487 RepID=A0A1T4XJP4_9GAMM|nr:Wzz/FepE/Etk N-terminal domain-containing protein [Thiothrix eikelboomii]SKA89311.1 LPS O-antigen chain length determinant protein, WzzB/FepE family [Thiothrix eikelboomii]